MAKNMNWSIQWEITVNGVPLGAGPMSVPSMQAMSFFENSPSGGGNVIVPCTGSTPTQANFNTALSTCLTNMEAALALQLTTIQNWNSGNP